jgi:hypothetical protein
MHTNSTLLAYGSMTHFHLLSAQMLLLLLLLRLKRLPVRL